MDDVKLEGKVQVVASDVQAIIDAYPETGLRLNPSKCETVCSNFDILNEYPVFKEFKRVKKRRLNSPRSPCPERQSSRQSAGYQDNRTQNGYRTAIITTRTRRTLSLT